MHRTICGMFLCGVLAAMALSAGELRVGIVGCDTSHATAFAEILHNPKNTGDLAGLRIVAAFPGGSADIPSSINRVPQFVEKLKAMNVEIVDSVDALLPKVDAVLLESSDGRVRLEQAKAVFKAKKPVFIDKPFAASLKDAVEIFRLAKEAGVPCFSSSALRYCKGIAAARTDGAFGEIMGCEAWSPYSTEPHHPDLFWYGIHGVESLFTIMGPGCVSVQRVKSDHKDVVVIGTWKDGRVGIFRGLAASKGGYGATVYGTKSAGSAGGFTGYQGLVEQVAKFLKNGTVPVSPEETIEIYAFMEAADESKRQDGAVVKIETVLTKAM